MLNEHVSGGNLYGTGAVSVGGRFVMGYYYENSTPDRFQHLCQSLLAATFPSLQCFPVGQPDGGRDAWDPETKTVLQVKFRRNDEKENADWLIEALEGELPKIQRLVERGAQRYVMATNARGTAHLDAGRIDKVQSWLDDNVEIPAVCFWRDEIDRRLDTAPTALKLKHSDILSFEDGLEIAFSAGSWRDDERQRDAIRSFVATQFDRERTVKFKQVDLSNDLFNLFIDVPVDFPRSVIDRLDSSLPPEEVRKLISSFNRSERQRGGEFYENIGDLRIRWEDPRSTRMSLGAAEFLLSSAAQDHIKLIVLEGAPGQGKSTLAQYVCQVHRARYLKKRYSLEAVPEVYRNAPFRVPIKVDLRDYAAFLEGNSPFGAASTGAHPLTLEVFLAQLVAYHSGGIDFHPHDVLTLLKSAPTLLFLDGLDEVADITAREALVSSIGEALARWHEFDTDIQVVATSRPSIFGRAPSFRKYGFQTVTLENIDSEHIRLYADKWVAARHLEPAESSDVIKILDQKLELAHIRDLTRNPMQLTILLSLIHQIGHSLPDQRTDLYSRYVDLFLTREADKSVRVRENRQVLLGFIEHLAWILQTEAESSKSAGSISTSDLQAMARDYLSAGGHSVEIADDLFGGGLERIFVLVPRIEGLFEFEVQPLREYFCARYLYSTAPVATRRGSELHGDRAQRFEALASNPLWLNVCRFYAGFCERGETGTLVLILEEMIQTGSSAISLHARRVGLALLQDWVFSNVKFTQNRLIRAVFDDIGIHIHAVEMPGISGIQLDPDCGQETLRQEVFQQLASWPVDTRTSLLCTLLRINGGKYLNEKFCQVLLNTEGPLRTSYLVRMLRSGATEDLTPEEIWSLITADEPAHNELMRRASELVNSQWKSAIQIQSLVDVFVPGVLEGMLRISMYPRSPIGMFADLLGNTRGLYWAIHRTELRGGSLASTMTSDAKEVEVDLTPEPVHAFLSAMQDIELKDSDQALDVRESPIFWDAVVEKARVCFGESWSTFSIAIQIAGIPTSSKLPDGSDRLFGHEVALCGRARAARLRRGGPAWWVDQLAENNSVQEEMFWVVLVLTWASVDNLYALKSEVNRIVDALSDEQYSAVRATVATVASGRPLRSDRKRVASVDLRPFSNRCAVLVALAFRKNLSHYIHSRDQMRSEPFRTLFRDMKEQETLATKPEGKDVEATLAWARRVNDLRFTSTAHVMPALGHLYDMRLIAEAAEQVLAAPRMFPRELVDEAILGTERRHRAPSLLGVSRKERWVFD